MFGPASFENFTESVVVPAMLAAVHAFEKISQLFARTNTGNVAKTVRACVGASWCVSLSSLSGSECYCHRDQGVLLPCVLGLQTRRAPS
jgi:hypothetical protein